MHANTPLHRLLGNQVQGLIAPLIICIMPLTAPCSAIRSMVRAFCSISVVFAGCLFMLISNLYINRLNQIQPKARLSLAMRAAFSHRCKGERKSATIPHCRALLSYCVQWVRCWKGIFVLGYFQLKIDLSRSIYFRVNQRSSVFINRE